MVESSAVRIANRSSAAHWNATYMFCIEIKSVQSAQLPNSLSMGIYHGLPPSLDGIIIRYRFQSALIINTFNLIGSTFVFRFPGTFGSTAAEITS